MENIRNRYLILITFMMLMSVIAHVLSYETFYKTEEGVLAISGIPNTMGKWKGRDFTVEERVYEILETRSIVHRLYTSGDTAHEVFLSVVYYPETKTGFHTPDFCLAARGVQTYKDSKNISIQTDTGSRDIEVTQLVYEIDNRLELAYYFFKAGDYVGHSYIRLRLSLAMNKMLSKNKSASLIRVSTIVPYGNSEKASNDLEHFIEVLYPYMTQYL